MDLLKFVFLCGLSITTSYGADVEYVIEIPQGKIKGLKTTTEYHEMTFFSFKGIPYSVPKVGEYKFDPPELPLPWEGTWDATAHRAECVQYDPIFKIIRGSEDCLFLNVYTPEMNNVDTCFPVMVWIHGGAFMFGSGNDDIYGPDFLIEQKVVVVTINYRLGPLGFLNTQDKFSVGNLGLKDQSYALRWVKNNIEYFNGCSENVTIFGESAGSASVHYHLLSPMSKGLFQRSIQQSGSATDEWAYNYNPRKAAFNLGERLGIHTDNSEVLMSSLKKIDGVDILKVCEELMEDVTLEVILLWIPSVEVENEGVEIFLPDHPMTLIKDGKITDVPMIAGVNLDECALFLEDILDHIEKNFDYIYAEMHTLLPNNMNVTDENEAKMMVKEIYKFYFGEKNITRETSTELLELLNDLLFFIQYHITTLIAGEHISSPIYKFLLTHRTPEGILKSFKNLGNVSSHADDLEYLWNWRIVGNSPKPGSSAEYLVNLYTTLWTNFAKYGNPTAVQGDVVNFVWEPMGKHNKILNINLQPKMETGFFPERMNFWVRMYQKVLGEFGELLTMNLSSPGSATIVKLSSLLIPSYIILYVFLFNRNL